MVLCYTVRISDQAERALRDIPKQDQKRIGAKVEGLARNPRPRGCVVLKGGGEGYLRIRVGDYRVVYTVNDEAVLVLVLKVGHRRDVYR